MVKTPKLLPGERFDDLNCKGYHVIQNPDSFCFGIDAVLLANFANVKPGKRVLDLCTGSAVIPILMAAKTKAGRIDALELNEEVAERAKRSIEANELEKLVYITQGDVCNAKKIYGNQSMDVITVNPPYMTTDSGLHNPNDAKNMARHEVYCTLEDVISQSSALLKEKGTFFMVHRPSRLPEIFHHMVKYKIQPKRMRLVQSYIDKEPNMVLIEGIKGGGARLNIDTPLVIYNKDGSYTDDVPKDE